MYISSDFYKLQSMSQNLQKKINSVNNFSYQNVLQSELSMDTTPSFEDMWRMSFERHYNQLAEQTFYHVMDASSIQRGTWVHNDFPYGAFLTDNLDESVLTWQPTRSNPSQLDSKVQSKIHATLGKNAIVVPPELNDKLNNDSELRKKVIANIDKVYAFHAPSPLTHMTMPGTKFYGTRVYSSVIILDNDGEVSNCVVSSGGGFIGPDEHTLKQIEEEQKRKLKRKAFNQMIIEEAQLKYFAMKHDLNMDIINTADTINSASLNLI